MISIVQEAETQRDGWPELRPSSWSACRPPGLTPGPPCPPCRQSRHAEGPCPLHHRPGLIGVGHVIGHSTDEAGCGLALVSMPGRGGMPSQPRVLLSPAQEGLLRAKDPPPGHVLTPLVSGGPGQVPFLSLTLRMTLVSPSPPRTSTVPEGPSTEEPPLQAQ